MASSPRPTPSDLPDDPFLEPADEHPLLDRWRRGAPFLGDLGPLLVLGLGAVILGAFLHQLWASTTAGEGLAKTAGWFMWAGRAVIGATFLMAALRPSAASDALRVALMAAGAIVLLGVGGLVTV